MSNEGQNNNASSSGFGLWRPPRDMGLARALQKAGYGSRKQMIQLVIEGGVEVNGESTDNPLFAVNPDSIITIAGKSLHVLEFSYYAINKPSKVVCSPNDGPNRRLLEDFYPANIPGLVAAGRMDGKTTGLMLVSNDTAWNTCFTQCMDLEQEYRIQFEGELTSLELELIKGGVQLPSGGIFKPIAISVVEVLNGCTVLNMVVIGKIRLVKYLLKSLQHKVVYLRRLRLGIIRLASLSMGESRPLTEEEIQFIKNCKLSTKRLKNSDEEK